MSCGVAEIEVQSLASVMEERLLDLVPTGDELGRARKKALWNKST